MSTDYEVEIDESALFPDETPNEREARLETEQTPVYDKKFIEDIIDKLLAIQEVMSGVKLHGYQEPFARRILNSLLTNDGATLTALFSRQSGKTETVADTIIVAMVMMPRLAKIYPDLLGQFKDGLWVGAFAPTDGQADIIYGRIISKLSSDRGTEFLQDPEIADKLVKVPNSKVLTYRLKNCGSLISKQTAHSSAKIEGRTYHVVLIDECQDAEESVVKKSISPMCAAVNGTKVYIGTPGYHKGVFYKQIQINKRSGTQRGKKQDHYQADYREVMKWNKLYAKYVQGEMLSLGEESNEFKMAYKLVWMLDKGMFTTSDVLDLFEDNSMDIVPAWNRSPVVVGIDPARKTDSTIVTVVWVDWDHPDEMGFYDHRILAWLDLEGQDWEVQYARIAEFLSNYWVFAIGVDEGGVGDVVISRLRKIFPGIDIVPMGSSRPEQSKRWKHLLQLFEKNYTRFGFPSGSKTKRLKVWKRFRQQFEDLELHYEGPHVIARAPDETGAHDDYADSLAIACMLSEGYSAPVVEQSINIFYQR